VKTASVVEMKAISKNPSDDLPNQEKNQYPELVIDGNKGLYILKGDKESDQENVLIRKNRSKKITDLLEEGKTETVGKVNAGIKTQQPVWNDLFVHERKDKLAAASLKRL